MTKARSAKMKSNGEISIAPLPGRISGILEAQGAGKRQPQESQHSGLKGRRDRLPPRAAHRLENGKDRKKLNAKNDRFPPSSGKPYGAMWGAGFLRLAALAFSARSSRGPAV
jgi:hypothetical protein